MSGTLALGREIRRLRRVIDYAAMDFFRDDAFVADPFPYFEFLREQCPVQREQQHDVVMVTGYDEASRSTTTPSGSRRARR